MAKELSPRELKNLREDLEGFRTAYVQCLGSDEEATAHGPLRRKVLELMPAAEKALTITGSQIAFTDPPAAGTGMVYQGLANVAFLHERPGFRLMGAYGEPGTYDAVVDALDLGSARLAEQERRVSRERRRPLYWLDRIMRALLIFPAYLVGLLIGQSTAKVNASQFGLLLRIAAVIADGFALYGGGKLLGLW
jgi:hypothetical protein